MKSSGIAHKCFRMECHHRIRWTLYSCLAIIFIFLSVSEVKLFSAVKKAFLKPSEDQKYIIVFDGGSTGTRIHVFSFINNTEGQLILQDEYFEETKPGLSSYANKPRKAADSVKVLLDKAKAVIPDHLWYTTPVMVKATAGLRLLPTHKSNMILDEVYQLINDSPFHCEKACVSVLDGEDEGIFAWFTLNFLIDRLREPNQSVGLLDLGGGSTQVTFAPAEFDSLVTSPHGFIMNRRILGRTQTIYSHSYLGLGLMSARLSILKSTSNNTESKTLRSPCVSPHVKANWIHGTETFQVKGMKSKLYNYEECYKRATEFLKSSVHKPVELSRRELYAVSYYFDRAVDIGIVNRSGGGGLVTIRKWIESAKIECTKKVPERPFLCFDTSYILALLQHGLGLNEDKEIKLVQEIDGIETSWGLGAAFSLVD